ncbi:hypothetical protein GCM10023147_03890 [Tsukamurella soli]|uniref:HTH araC/xylS-type domain-containing protein n=1 Tax=Tsukamurella soli TaxID=644556 RepID=A0ABP8J2S7_9ACTN
MARMATVWMRANRWMQALFAVSGPAADLRVRQNYVVRTAERCGFRADSRFRGATDRARITVPHRSVGHRAPAISERTR